MEKIKTGQLVRIKGFGKGDAIYGKPLEKLLIGLTGRFIRPIMSLDGYKTYAGDFEYDPDIHDANKFMPCFAYVIVELVYKP